MQLKKYWKAFPKFSPLDFKLQNILDLAYEHLRIKISCEFQFEVHRQVYFLPFFDFMSLASIQKGI
jgi:hypothetical protein